MIKIGRPIEGISLNGLEWLLTGGGEIMKFESTQDAIKFLRQNGFETLSEEDIEDSFIFEDDDEELEKL